MINLFTLQHAALIARCHRRSTLVDATEALRATLNSAISFSAGPACLLDTENSAATELAITYNGIRYTLAVRQTPDESN